MKPKYKERYLLLENGIIVDAKKTVCEISSEGESYIPCFNLYEDGTSAFSKTRIISRDNSLPILKQRLIEYCADKSIAEIALWVQNLKKHISLKPVKDELKIVPTQITKDHLIVQLINLNDKFLKGEFLD